MSISAEEQELLKVYITDTKQTTIHNLTVASIYFKSTNKEQMYTRLLNKIINMNDNDFMILKKYF